MELEDIESAQKWDNVRLAELLDKGKGCHFATEVIKQIGPAVSEWTDIPSLAHYLNRRHVLNRPDEHQLFQSNATGNKLIEVLLRASRVPGSGENLIPNLYLALLDMFHDTGDAWCHYAAFYVVGKQAATQLGFPSIMSQETDIATIITRLPPAIMPPETATQLQLHLNLHGDQLIEKANLREVVEHRHRFKFPLTLEDLVRALMLTPDLGRYVAKLLPFYKAFPKEVWYFLKRLQSQWKQFAAFIGFKKEEVAAIESSTPGNIKQQIKTFSKVWWMPDLGEGSNTEILEKVSHQARIVQGEDASRAVSKLSPHTCHGLQEPVTINYNTITYNIMMHSSGSDFFPGAPADLSNLHVLSQPNKAQVKSSSRGDPPERLQSQQSDSSVQSSASSTPISPLLREHSLHRDLSDESFSSDAPGNLSLGSAPSGSPLLHMQQSNSPPRSLKAKHHQPNPVVQEHHLLSRKKMEEELKSLKPTGGPSHIWRQFQKHHEELQADDGMMLIQAIKADDFTEAEGFLQSGCHVHGRDDGNTPLMYACHKNQERLVKLLLMKGADPQDFDKNGQCCLHFPETLRNPKILKMLLDEFRLKRVNVDVMSVTDECSPLMIACRIGSVKCAQLLLHFGANPDGLQNAARPPLIEACTQGHLSLVKLLLESGANYDIQDMSGQTALLHSCIRNQWQVARELIAKGANVNACDPHDCTSPLFPAIDANAIEIASELIQRGAHVNASRFLQGTIEGKVEETPLALAAGKGLLEMIDLLLDHGARINYLCAGAVAPLGFAIICNQVEAFHKLLDHPDLDSSLNTMSHSIVAAVKTENYYYATEIFNRLGGPEVVLQHAQYQQMSALEECTEEYLQKIQLMPNLSVPIPQMQLQCHQRDYYKVEEVLYQFCQVCRSAVLNSGVSCDALIDVAKATTTNPALAPNLEKIFHCEQASETLKQDFLHGKPSPLSFLVQNKVLTKELFEMELFQYFPERPEDFLNNLVWTFHQMPGGSGLPDTPQAILQHLFNGYFTPNVEIGSRRGNVPVNKRPPALYQPRAICAATRRPESIPDPQVPKLPHQQQLDVSAARSASGQPGRQKSSAGEPMRTRAASDLVPDSRKRERKPIPQKTASLPNDRARYQRQTPVISTDGRNVPARVPLQGPQGSDSKVPHQQPEVRASILPQQEFDEQTPMKKQTTVIPPLQLPPHALVEPTKTPALGCGSYGEVLEVMYGEKCYAAKKYYQRFTESGKLKHIFDREQGILSKLNHENIVPYFGVCQLSTDGSSVIVMERLETNLATYVENQNPPLETRISIMRGVAHGLEYVHSQNPIIIHRDLTATNVLLTSDGTAKIADFGNARMVDLTRTPELLTSTPGTLDYMAPEALEGNEYDDKVDVFSFGHLSIYAIIQHRPHPIRKPKCKGKALSEVERRQKYIDEMKDKLKKVDHPFLNIVKACLDDEPEQRPAIKDILIVSWHY